MSALSSWQVQTQRARSPQALVPDFVSLNRDALTTGAVTPKKLSQFRAQVGVATKQSHTPKIKAAMVPQGSVRSPDGGLGLRSRR